MKSKQKDELLIDGKLLTEMVKGGASELRSSAEEINELNVFPVPDGDTGDNMRMTLESGVSALENISSNDLATVMNALSHGMLLGARGNSGVILSQFFAGIAKGLDTYSHADAVMMGNALMLGVKQAYASVMTPKEGTILTVAREATEYAVKRITPKSTIRTLFGDLIKEMQRSLIRTPEMLPILKEAGVIDSGGAGLFHIMNGFNRVLNGDVPVDEEKNETMKKSTSTPSVVNVDAFGTDSVLTYGYCTEFLLRLQNSKVDLTKFDHEVIKTFLETVGDSIVAVRADSIVKVHVHTMEPEKVLDFCHRFGEFLTIKIENMSVQHHQAETPENAPVFAPAAPQKQYGSVAVCNGEGIRNAFLELGVDQVIDGGQTQNPSTSDFLEVFRKINARRIFVFPNNGNIVMAAKQAAEIYTEAEILVVETGNIGEGYAAVPMIEETEAVPTIMKRMQEAIGNVLEGALTVSVRDTDLNGCHIQKNDYIGISNKKIVSANPDPEIALYTLLDSVLGSNDRFLLTVFFGKDVTNDQKDAFRQHLATAYPDVEAYCIDGLQQVYPYILIAE